MFELLIVLSSLFTPVSGVSTTSIPTEQVSNGTEVIKMRVDSEKVSCGENSLTCFRVQKESSIGKDNWEVLQQEIVGFNFQPGYVYDLVVKISIVEGKTGPDRFLYTLEHVVSKIKA